MQLPSRMRLGVPIAALCAILLGAAPALAQNPKLPNSKPPKEAPVIHPALGDVPMGDPKAPVKMVAYLSLSCPHCRDWWLKEFPAFQKAYVDTGKVQFIYREYPLNNDGVDVGFASIGRCAGPSQYYALTDELFRKQPEIEATDSPGLILLDIAKRHGLSEPQVYACFDSEELLATIQASHDKGVADFAAQDARPETPGIFVDGGFLSDHSAKGMSAAADAALARHKTN